MISVSYGAASFTRENIILGCATLKQSASARRVVIPTESDESLVPRKLNRIRTHFSKKYRWN